MASAVLGCRGGDSSDSSGADRGRVGYRTQWVIYIPGTTYPVIMYPNGPNANKMQDNFLDCFYAYLGME